MASPRILLGALLALTPAPSFAQSIVGSWTGTVLTPEGQVSLTTTYSPDGTYETVEALPSGIRYAFWGWFATQPIDDTHETVTFGLSKWLPQRICRGAAFCDVFTPAAPMPVTVTFSDASNMSTASGSFHRVTDVNFPAIPATEFVPGTVFCRTNPKNGRNTFCVE